MFLHPSPETVSDHILKTGKLYCDGEVIARLYSSGIADFFFDVGSNIASCAFAAAALGKSVFAFEPNPHNIALIKRTIAYNKWEARITLIECGASNSTGTVDLFFLRDNKGHGMVGSRQERIKQEYLEVSSCTVKIDDVLSQLDNRGVDVVKIDTEGHELMVLKGAEILLRDPHKRPTFIQLEVNPEALSAQGTESGEIRDHLRSMEYHCTNEGGNTLHNEVFEATRG
jgi:FkbM family methyltransferase